jgi:hypothetical protein
MASAASNAAIGLHRLFVAIRICLALLNLWPIYGQQAIKSAKIELIVCSQRV